MNELLAFEWKAIETVYNDIPGGTGPATLQRMTTVYVGLAIFLPPIHSSNDRKPPMRTDRLSLLCFLALAWLAPAASRADDTAAAGDSSAKPAKGAKPDKGADSASGSDEEEKAKTTNKIPTPRGPNQARVRSDLRRSWAAMNSHPSSDISLDDPFFQKYFFGLKYAYHINSQFSLGVRGAFGFATPSSAVNVCNTQTGCASRRSPNCSKTPRQHQLDGGPRRRLGAPLREDEFLR